MHAPRFTLRIEGARSLLYDRTTHQYTRASAAEAFLLVASREAGTRAARALLEGRLGDVDAAVAYGRLRSTGALDDEQPFAGRVVELEPTGGAWAAPLVAHLGVTLACNYSCAHCYSSSGKRAKGELTLAEMSALVDELEAIGCMKLVLGGGEPFLRKDLAALVAYANARGVDCFVHTNASLVTAKGLAALASSPPAGLAVSLDGPDEESNDAIRGAGTFNQTLGGLALLRAGYPPGFSLSLTVTPQNAARTGDMVDVAKREGAKLLLLRPAYPAGAALSSSQLVSDRDTFAAAIDRARARAEAAGLALDAPHPYEQGEPDFDGFGCVAARVVLGISPTGDVTPCLSLPAGFVAGNVRSATLSSLWRAGDAFTRVRDAVPSGECGSCRHYDTCRGGCRVRALFAGHGLSGVDSWCHYQPREDDAPKPRPTRKSLHVVA